MSATRARATRRDRRKAKASGWARAGKTKMGRVGHGPNGSTLPPPGGLAIAPVAPAPVPPRAPPRPPLRASIADMISRKRR